MDRQVVDKENWTDFELLTAMSAIAEQCQYDRAQFNERVRKIADEVWNPKRISETAGILQPL